MQHAHEQPGALRDGLTWQKVRVDPQEGLGTLREHWRNLAETAGVLSWVYQPDSFLCWLRELRPDARAEVLTVRDMNGTLRGLMPVMVNLAMRGPAMAPRFDYDPNDRSHVVQRSPVLFPVRQLSLIASIPATMLWVGPLCADADMAGVADCLAEAMVSVRGWSVAVLPGAEGRDAAPMAAALEARGCTTMRQNLGREAVDIRSLVPVDEIIARGPQKFRQNIRRARRAADISGLNIRVLDEDEARARLDAFAELARVSWKVEGRANAPIHLPYDGPQRRFTEALAGVGYPDLRPAIVMAEDADGPVAGLLLWRFGSSVCSFLTFWNGRHEAASPGFLVMLEAIDWAHRTGARVFNFNSTSTYLRYLADHRTTICNTIAFAPSLEGRMLCRIRKTLRPDRG